MHAYPSPGPTVLLRGEDPNGRKVNDEPKPSGCYLVFRTPLSIFPAANQNEAAAEFFI